MIYWIQPYMLQLFYVRSQLWPLEYMMMTPQPNKILQYCFQDLDVLRHWSQNIIKHYWLSAIYLKKTSDLLCPSVSQPVWLTSSWWRFHNLFLDKAIFSQCYLRLPGGKKKKKKILISFLIFAGWEHYKTVF